ncbi:MAG: ABC transporter permease [Xanthobacteraceae bacterium]|nr:MAG: ABC transporter permease [Xanthobacteraceae bacterium]
MRSITDLATLSRSRELWLSIAFLIAILAAWEWLPATFGIPAFILPPISDIAHEFVRLYARENLWLHTGVTFAETIVGFIFGSLLGMITGYVLGRSRTAEIILSPYILMLQIAPKVAFAPLFIIWFGYNAFPKILVAILIVFFPIAINVLKAMHAVDPALVNLARTFSATRAQIFWKIEFPASMPALFAGLRIGSTLAVIGIVVGEFIGGNRGLGYLLIVGEGQGRTSMVFVSIVLLTLIGLIAYLCVLGLERYVLHYMPERSHANI